jgi:glycosyltransferase involved in cell wall biosynthesis
MPNSTPDRFMRICLYTNTALPCIGGQELVVDALARQFTHSGHEVVVLCPEPPQELRNKKTDLPYRVDRHRRFVSTRWFVEWYRAKLRRLVKSSNINVVHCHNVYPNGYLAVREKGHGGPPVVITSHGGDVRPDNPRFRKPGLRDKHRFAVEHADALISISDFTHKGFLHLGADPQKVHSIPNGVDGAAFAQEVARPESIPAQLQDKKFFLFLGRLAWRKGVDVLLQSFKLFLQSSHRFGQPQLAIAGNGQEMDALKNLSQQLGLQERATFLGMVTGSAKTWLLQQAYSLVMPTREWEAFPLVLLEAFAAGCPVIGSDAPGLTGLVQSGQTGWVVPRETPSALAEAIRQSWNQPDAVMQISKAVKHRAKECTWEQIARRHLELFDRLRGDQEQPSRQKAG